MISKMRRVRHGRVLEIYAAYALFVFLLGMVMKTTTSVRLPSLWPLYYTGIPAAVWVAVDRIGDQKAQAACGISATGAIAYAYVMEIEIGYQFDWSILPAMYLIVTLWAVTARKSFKNKGTSLDTKLFPERVRDPLLERKYGIGVLLFVLAVSVRIWDTSFLQGSDTFVLIAAKALHQNGQTHYNRFFVLSSTIAHLFDWFSVSLFWARFPTIVASSLTVVITYAIGLRVSKPVGIGGGILAAVSPWSISMSHFIRGYEINVLLITGAILGLILISEIDEKPRKVCYALVVGVAVAALGLVAFSEIDRNSTVKIGVLNVAIAGGILLAHRSKTAGYDFTSKTVKILTVCGYALVFAAAGWFSDFLSGLELDTVWVQVFVNPFVPYPMLWYSFVNAAIVVVPIVVMVGLVRYHEHPVFQIGLCIVLTNLVLFSFRFESHLAQPVTPRYIYHTHPFFALVLSAGVVTTIRLIARWSGNERRTLVLSLALVLLVVNPWNSLIAMEESRSLRQDDPRQPTSIGNRDHLNDLFGFMRSSGFQGPDDVLVTAGIHNYFIWEFDYPVATDRAVYLGGAPYDIGENICVESEYFGVHELNATISARETGWYVQYSNAAPDENFTMNGAEFDYLGTRAGFNVYRWNSTTEESDRNQSSIRVVDNAVSDYRRLPSVDQFRSVRAPSLRTPN